MAYCTTANVASEFKNITFDSNSSVTNTEVDAFIAQADAEIDGILGKRYEVPITGVSALLIIKQVSIWLVKFRVQEILQVKTSNPDVHQEGAETNFRKMALAILKDIVSGKIVLSDATLAASGDGFKSYAYDNDLDTDFHKGVDEW